MATISIADNDARVQYTQAITGNSTTLTIDFPFFSLDDIKVVVTTSAGIDVVFGGGSGYTRGTGTGTFAVTGTAVDDGFSGGTLTLNESYDNTHTITIYRDITVSRTADFPTAGPFNISSLNTELDKLTAIIQQNNNNFARTIKLNESDAAANLTVPTSATRANKYLGFDGSGNLSALSGTGSTIGTIQTANLADLLVTTAKLAANAVTTVKILNDAITSDKIVNGAVTSAKLATGAAVANIGASGIATSLIADDAITFDKLNTNVTQQALLLDKDDVPNSGGTFSSGDWRTRPLNTESFDIGNIVTLSSNQFTLGAGAYIIDARGMAMRVNDNQMRIYNITDSTTDIVGMNTYFHGTYGGGSNFLMGQITITGTKVFELQHRCETSRSSDGFGPGHDFGIPNIHTMVHIIKLPE